jgi:hypothetical protein
MNDQIPLTDFGAVGDGATPDTAALQAALDRAAARGGGVVVVPPGRYRCGTIHLRSNVTLELRRGATLLGSPEIADYPPTARERQGDRHRHHLLLAQDCHNIAIRGGGVIDGNGPAFWEPQAHPRAWIGAKSPRVSPMIELQRCADVLLEDVTITNSPGWTVHAFCCDRLRVRGVQLRNHLFGPNTDGLDINGCRDVMISDCLVECGDDAIVLKTTRDARSCQRVCVTNCVVRSNCAALKCGTESWHDHRQIVFSNCVVHKSTRAIALYCLDGATIEDVAVSNIVCDTNSGFVLNRPLHIDLRRRTDDSSMGVIRNVTVSDLIARTDGRILLTAEDGGQLRDITLRNVSLAYPALEDPVPLAPHARSQQFSNRSAQARAARAAVVADNIAGLRIEGLTVRWPKGEPPPDWELAGRAGHGVIGEAQAGGTASVLAPDFHVLWGRNLTEAWLDCPLATANRPNVERFHLVNSDARVRD